MPRRIEVMDDDGWRPWSFPADLLYEVQQCAPEARYVGGTLEGRVPGGSWSDGTVQAWTLDEARMARPDLEWRLTPHPDEPKASVQAPPQTVDQDRADLLLWRNDQPGHCACGILRELCEYHKDQPKARGPEWVQTVEDQLKKAWPSGPAPGVMRLVPVPSGRTPSSHPNPAAKSSLSEAEIWLRTQGPDPSKVTGTQGPGRVQNASRQTIKLVMTGRIREIFPDGSSVTYWP